MAGAAAAKDGMSVGEMKKLLNTAQLGKPLKCALGLDGDGKAIVVLDRLKQPRMLETELKKDHPDAKLVRFGTAFIDEIIPTQVNISLNKPAQGLARRVVKALKGTGYSKVKILSKDENGIEVADTVDDDEPEASGQAHPAPAAADPPVARPTASADAASASAAPTASADAAVASAAAVPETASPSTPPAASSEMASPSRAAADGSGAAVSAPKDPRSPATVLKAKAAWLATMQHFEADLEKLLSKMSEAYEGHGFAGELEKVFKTKVDPVLSKLDKELAADLDGIIKAQDRDTQTAAVRTAQKRIQGYAVYLKTEPMLAKLDANPFTKINLVGTVATTLSVLNKAVSAMA